MTNVDTLTYSRVPLPHRYLSPTSGSVPRPFEVVDSSPSSPLGRHFYPSFSGHFTPPFTSLHRTFSLLLSLSSSFLTNRYRPRWLLSSFYSWLLTDTLKYHSLSHHTNIRLLDQLTLLYHYILCPSLRKLIWTPIPDLSRLSLETKSSSNMLNRRYFLPSVLRTHVYDPLPTHSTPSHS